MKKVLLTTIALTAIGVGVRAMYETHKMYQTERAILYRLNSEIDTVKNEVQRLSD